MGYVKKFVSVMLTIITLAVAAGCNRQEYRLDRAMIWNTTYNVTYESADNLTDSILTILNRVGASLNVFDDNSLVSRVNRSDSVLVDNDFIRVYEMSRSVNKLSDGAFDPTLGPLITAWGFGRGHEATGDTLRLDSLLRFTGISKTKLSAGTLYKEDRRIQFNFSAIAKGYGCDEVGAMLRRNGATNYLVEIGGELACSGRSPQGKAWRVMVDKPLFSDSVIHEEQCIIEVSDCGLATSGNYRNYHGSGASRYGHTISPETGRPVLTDVLSATVVAGSSMEADALATAMMALGSDKAQQLAMQLKLPVMLVLSDMDVWMTEGFKALIVSEP